MYFRVFGSFSLCACVSIGGPQLHTTRTVVLREAVIHCSPHYCRSRLPLMCSFHCVSSSLSFNSSVHILFFFISSPSPPFTHSLSCSLPSLQLLALFASSLAGFVLFIFLSLISGSLPPHISLLCRNKGQLDTHLKITGSKWTQCGLRLCVSVERLAHFVEDCCDQALFKCACH